MNGLSKQKQKYIQSLHIKKYRQQFGFFIVEGQKSLEELAKSDFDVKEVYLTERGSDLRITNAEISFCSEKDIEKVSSFRSNNYGIAIVACKPNEKPIIKNEWVLALDEIRDPGNLGTIIRIADWYGINKIICSENTVELYNPKVISSTMGSFSRVNCFYTNLKEYLPELDLPVYGAYLNGQNIHQLSFPESGVLLMGSESHGISAELEHIVSNKITIPAFGHAESLNAGIATAVILDNIRRP
ncbi:RNA methyltransferase [Arcticibacterium luteifluviistationis]|uniref:RNA methyltransferase n=1 Tax=Arcticibacterium luteifluviistationis TaxID=1784714 RepID=A0A2Z4GAW5_9BACT|nr:RNA methyltransferase [Arcticibacterium luteifluviistationis]AWV98215.1 RNA methyltransferase [Arcticibacterium luteifluviistationis]